MANTPENPVDGYKWKKFTAHEAPKVLAWMVGSSPVLEPEPEAPDMAQIGFDEGYAKGFAAGEADGLAQNKATHDQLTLLVDECRRLLERQQEEHLAEAATVMSGLFRVLFEHELQTSEHMLQALIDRAKPMLDGKKNLRIHLNAEDYNSLSNHVSPGVQAVLVADEKLPSGVVQASSGQSIVELDVVNNMRELLLGVDLEDIEAGDSESEVIVDE